MQSEQYSWEAMGKNWVTYYRVEKLGYDSCHNAAPLNRQVFFGSRPWERSFFILFYFIFRFCSTQVIWVTSKISTFVLHGIGNSIWVWNDIRTSLCFGWCFPLNSLKTCQNTIWWWLGRWHELKWVVSAAWAVS